MTYSVDEQGMLLQPGFHDGFLVGLRLGSNTLDLCLRNSRGEAFRMRLSGLQRLVSNDFREGNIISTVWVVNRIRPVEAFVRAIYGDPYPTVGSPYRERHEQMIVTCINSIAEGTLTLVAIEPSYGCELHALCDEVLFEPA